MKKYNLLTLLFFFCALSAHAEEWIRINQLGYLPQSIKVAVFMSEEGTDIQSFQISSGTVKPSGRLSIA